jgi:hypothetical protein
MNAKITAVMIIAAIAEDNHPPDEILAPQSCQRPLLLAT